jgi:hypothetical protein
MKRTTLLALSAAVLAVAAAYVIGRGSAPGPHGNGEDADAVAHAAGADRGAADLSSSMPIPAASRRKGGPLPPAGSPLSGTFAALQSRAKAGDAEAATRLVHDLDRCNRLRASQWKNARATDNLTRRNTDGMSAAQLRTYQALLDAMELRQRGVREDASLCAGVDDDMIDSLVPNIAQAARLGDEDARACYLGKGPLYDTRSLLAHPESLRSYRSDATALMEAGLAAGDWRVVDLLQQAYEPGAQGLLAGVVGSDPVQHYRYLKLYRLGAEAHRTARLEQRLASAASNLTAMQRADADAWAQANLRDRFEGNSTSATPEGWEACSF